MKYAFLFLGAMGLVAAQPYACSTTGATNIVRSEGLTERVGDIFFNCTEPTECANYVSKHCK